METTQVQQLKLNVTNISSFLKKSNKKYIDLKKSNKAIVAQEVKKTKVKTKESKVEQRISPKTSPLAAVKKIASPAMSMFDKIINFGSILATGVFLNFLPAIKKKIDEFKKDNKEVIDNVVSTLTYVKNFGEDVSDWLTEPEADHGFFSKIAEFDPHTGRITGGALKTVEDTFDGFGVLINRIDKAIGGKGTAGNAFLRDRSDEIAGVNVSKSNLQAQTETKSGMATFREDSAQNAALQEKVKARMQKEKEQARNPGAASGGGGYYGSKEQKAMLSAISFAEGTTRSYGTIYGGKIVPELAKGKLAIAQVLEMQRTGKLNGRDVGYARDSRNSDATGRYQFMSYVLREEIQKQRISANSMFTPAMQDRIILGRIARFRGVTDALLKKEGMSDRVIDMLAPEFASFPNLFGPDNQGRVGTNSSFYGQGGKSATSIRNVYNRALGGQKVSQVTPSTGNKNKQVAALNTTMGEEGSTTFILARQPILT